MKFNFIRQEKHLIKPKLSMRVQSKQLFDTLFQYTKNEAEEIQLRQLIDRIRAAESGAFGNGPFSVSLEEIAYLEEGCKELELLGWVEVPVFVFEIEKVVEPDNADESFPTAVHDLLKELVLFNISPTANQVYMYPKALEAWA